MARVPEAYEVERIMMLRESLADGASQRKQLIQPTFRLIRRPGNKSKLCTSRALVALESCANYPENQDAGERESVIQPLACVQMQKHGFGPFCV